MTNKEIFDLYEGLCEIGMDKDLKFEIRVSYIFAKAKHILEPYYKAILETRTKLLDKYGKAADNGDWIVSKENVADFTREWDTFMGIENVIVLEKIKIEDLKEEKLGIELMEKLLNLIDK